MQRYEWILKSKKLHTDPQELLATLLASRGVTKESSQEWFAPSLSIIRFDIPSMEKAVARIKQAIAQKEPITVYSDYDADGICGVAILWQALRDLGAHALPYIPHREKEGYGLKSGAVEKLAKEGTKVIITVDCGITSGEAVKRANNLGVDVIITDHHIAPKELPQAHAIVHDTNVCGAAVAWKLAQCLSKHYCPTNYLELVAIATIGDLMPLTGENRVLVYLGLHQLNATENIGLKALVESAGIRLGQLGTYEVGYLIVPRINALGRLGHAIDALRLLCTKHTGRAQQLACLLSSANAQRQLLTTTGVEHALHRIETDKIAAQKIITMADASWQQGIIGLIAGKLVDQYVRPAVIMSQGELVSKGSCRSVPGFNIVQALRMAQDLLIDVGGHPMAAGFTIETKNIPLLVKRLEEIANKSLTDKHLTRTLMIDAPIPLGLVQKSLHRTIQTLSPFGMGNPEPVFTTSSLDVTSIRSVGNGGKHLKLSVTSGQRDDCGAIAFGRGSDSPLLSVGDTLDLAYTVSVDTWNGDERLQLKVKDWRRSAESAKTQD